jgi:hypothetical protein
MREAIVFRKKVVEGENKFGVERANVNASHRNGPWEFL